MRKLKLIIKHLFILLVALSLSNCSNQDLTPVLGCTEGDALNFDVNATTNNGSCAYLSKEVVGEWTASIWALAGNDYVCSGFGLTYDFKSDGQFDYTFNGDVIPSLSGHGKWVSVGKELRLSYEGQGLNTRLVNTLTKYGSLEAEQFETTFEDGYNQLNLFTQVGNTSLDIELTKKRNRPVDKDNF